MSGTPASTEGCALIWRLSADWAACGPEGLSAGDGSLPSDWRAGQACPPVTCPVTGSVPEAVADEGPPSETVAGAGPVAATGTRAGDGCACVCTSPEAGSAPGLCVMAGPSGRTLEEAETWAEEPVLLVPPAFPACREGWASRLSVEAGCAAGAGIPFSAFARLPALACPAALACSAVFGRLGCRRSVSGTGRGPAFMPGETAGGRACRTGPASPGSPGSLGSLGSLGSPAGPGNPAAEKSAAGSPGEGRPGAGCVMGTVPKADGQTDDQTDGQAAGPTNRNQGRGEAMGTPWAAAAQDPAGRAGRPGRFPAGQALGVAGSADPCSRAKAAAWAGRCAGSVLPVRGAPAGPADPADPADRAARASGHSPCGTARPSSPASVRAGGWKRGWDRDWDRDWSWPELPAPEAVS